MIQNCFKNVTPSKSVLGAKEKYLKSCNKKNIGKHELHVVDSADAEDVIGKKSDAHDSKESPRFASRLRKISPLFSRMLFVTLVEISH